MSSDIIRKHLLHGELQLARAAVTHALLGATAAEEGALYALLSRTWLRLGCPEKAMKAAEEAASRSEHWEVTLALGEALIGMGQPRAAQALLVDGMRRARGQARPPAEDPDTEAEVALAVALAEAYRASGDAEAGLDMARRAARHAEKRFGLPALQTAEALFAQGSCLRGAGKADEARDVLRRALDIRRAHVPESTDVAATLDALGAVERVRRKPFEAVKLHREALTLWINRLGEEASPVGACRHMLAQALHRTGDFLAAREEMRQAAEITRNTLGEDHVDTWITAFELGRFEMDCGELDGLRQMEKAKEAVEQRLGKSHPVVRAMASWL